MYSRYGTETISALPYLLGGPAIYTSSLEVARQIVSTKGSFCKSPEITAITLYVPHIKLSCLLTHFYNQLLGPKSFCG